MRRVAVVGVGLLIMVTAWTAVNHLGGTAGVSAQAAGSLPQSLDNLYPPNARGPAWLMAMLGMSASFSGMVTDFMEEDFENADRGYDEFRRKFEEVSHMVPEWADEFAAEPMDALGKALKSRDPAEFMPAVDRASQVCHGCHVKNMTPVQQKYHWADFSIIMLTDPVTKQDMPFTIFMRMLDSALTGVQVDVAQGQMDRAAGQAEALAARYETLKEACEACHDTERTYYVDAGITGMIGKLKTAVGDASGDPAGVQELVQAIGMESCHKCHLVHGPAALARYAGSPSMH